MRRLLVALVLVAVGACSDPVASKGITKGGPAPVGPLVLGTINITSDGVGGITLDLIARLTTYGTEVHQLRVGAECPLGIHLQAEGASTPYFITPPGVQCPTAGATVRLAAGDTVVQTRTLRDREIATLPPGRYRLYAVVHTTTLVEEAPVGVITLPLTVGK